MVQFPDSVYTDEELLTLLQQGSRDSFEILYKKYWKQLFNSAYKRLQSREIVEELVQDIFVDLWSKREIMQINSSLQAYLFTALRYKLFSYFRSQLIRKRHVDYILHHSEGYENFVEDQLYYEELARALENSVGNLPEKYRTIYRLSRNENLTYKEIAAHLNIPVDTVEKQMGKALKLLRIQLKDYAWLAVLCAGFSN
jgi:RNA polymerase sigma-70 factor (ECF subfamily)